MWQNLKTQNPTNSKTQNVTKLKKSKCDKYPNVTKLKKSKCDQTQKLKMWRKNTQNLKMWQNSKLKMWQSSTTQNVTTKKFKMWQNSKTQNVFFSHSTNIFCHSKKNVTNLKKLKLWQLKISNYYKLNFWPNLKKKKYF